MSPYGTNTTKATALGAWSGREAGAHGVCSKQKKPGRGLGEELLLGAGAALYVRACT